MKEASANGEYFVLDKNFCWVNQTLVEWCFQKLGYRTICLDMTSEEHSRSVWMNSSWQFQHDCVWKLGIIAWGISVYVNVNMWQIYLTVWFRSLVMDRKLGSQILELRVLDSIGKRFVRNCTYVSENYNQIAFFPKTFSNFFLSLRITDYCIDNSMGYIFHNIVHCTSYSPMNTGGAQ
jgi:hypothetical protein